MHVFVSPDSGWDEGRSGRMESGSQEPRGLFSDGSDQKRRPTAGVQSRGSRTSSQQTHTSSEQVRDLQNISYISDRLWDWVCLLWFSSLSEVRPAAVNTTSAAQTNTNIRANTQLAEDLAHAANQSASSALNQVRQPITASGYCNMRAPQRTS